MVGVIVAVMQGVTVGKRGRVCQERVLVVLSHFRVGKANRVVGVVRVEAAATPGVPRDAAWGGM